MKTARAIALSFVSLLILLAAAPSWAATFPVNSTIDAVDGKYGDGECFTGKMIDDVATGTQVKECTLRAAIQEANSTVDADTIKLEGKVYTLSLEGDYEAGSALVDAQRDLDIMYDLTITGTGSEGANATVIDAQNLFRVFHISWGGIGETPPVVKIEKLVIRNGNGGGKGGGIYIINGGKLTLSETSVMQNFAENGGGIYQSQGEVTIEKCNIFSNTSSGYGGGGIYVTDNGKLTIDNSKIYMNSHNGSNAGDNGGSGIRVDGSGPAGASVTITNSAILENTASGAGGGIVAKNALVSIIGSTVANNKSGSGGGGIMASTGTILMFIQSVLAGNTTNGVGAGLNNYGGGDANKPQPTTYVTSSTVTGNKNEVALANASNGQLNIVNSSIVGNDGKEAISNLSSQGGQISLLNSIVVGNSGGDCWGGTSQGHNLLGATCNNFKAAESDKTGLTLETAGIGALVDNKIAGHLHFPLLDGPAIDAGSQDACAKVIEGISLKEDQLGHSRLNGCDIGAIEATHMDGITQKQLGEECDDGNDNNDDGCLNTNKLAKCGDGIVWAGAEMCDDGNDVNDDMCPNTCKSPTCGDGITQATSGETCDDGNQVNDDACLNSCVVAKCGDGLMQSGVEGCDDGNIIEGDGCSAACKVEPKVETKPVVATTEITGTGATVGGEAPPPAGAGATTPATTPAGGGTPVAGTGDVQAPAPQTPAAEAKTGCSLIIVK